MVARQRPLAVVTGASSGIGYALARCCAENGFDLLVAADENRIEQAAAELREQGASVTAIEADLATTDGVDKLLGAIKQQGRPVEALLANAGRGLGRGFLDQDFAAARRVIDTNITGTIYLIHAIGKEMRERHQGRILITGSIAGFMPGTFQAVYSGTKAFLDSFSFALRHELKDTGVTVTCLMPGATDTKFFERADMMDTKVGQAKKSDPAEVARAGFEAMMSGRGEVITGWQNKLQSAAAHLLPAGVSAAMHRSMAAPGTGRAARGPGDGDGMASRGAMIAGLAIGTLAIATAVGLYRRRRDAVGREERNRRLLSRERRSPGRLFPGDQPAPRAHEMAGAGYDRYH